MFPVRRRFPAIPHRAPLGTVLAVASLAIAGCTVTAIPPTEEDDARARVLELEREVEALAARTRELETALAASERARGADPAVLAAAPFATELVVGRWSGLAGAQQSAAPTLLLYLEPRDARGRVVQVAGTLSVDVFALPPAGEPRRVGGATLDPQALRERFRSGFMGTHYTIEIPLAADAAAAGALLVRASLADGLGGRDLRAETILDEPGEAGR